MGLAAIKTTVRLKFRGSETGHSETPFASALICSIDNQCSEVVVYDEELSIGRTAIKHIFREFQQMRNEEAAARWAQPIVLLGLDN